MSTEWKKVGNVKKLCIYPFKSGKRIEVDEAECTKQGFMEVNKQDDSFLLRDRTFVVYQNNTLEYKAAKHYPKLVLIQIKSHNTNSIELTAPNMESIIVSVPNKEDELNEVSIKQIEEEIPVLDCGDPVASWISKYILNKESGLRLGYNDGTHKRNHKTYQKVIDFNNRGMTFESMGLSSNLCAVLLLNAASVRDVQKTSGISQITEDNFRPNILVDDDDLEPFIENDWDFIKIGNVIFKNVLECTRCLLTTVNMEEGILRPDREPLKSMEKYRLSKGPHKAPIMGVYLEVIQTGRISLNDNVYVGKEEI